VYSLARQDVKRSGRGRRNRRNEHDAATVVELLDDERRVSASSISTNTGWNISSSLSPEMRRITPRRTPKPGIDFRNSLIAFMSRPPEARGATAAIHGTFARSLASSARRYSALETCRPSAKRIQYGLEVVDENEAIRSMNS
jgi:hypothetical protein